MRTKYRKRKNNLLSTWLSTKTKKHENVLWIYSFYNHNLLTHRLSWLEHWPCWKVSPKSDQRLSKIPTKMMWISTYPFWSFICMRSCIQYSRFWKYPNDFAFMYITSIFQLTDLPDSWLLPVYWQTLPFLCPPFWEPPERRWVPCTCVPEHPFLWRPPTSSRPQQGPCLRHHWHGLLHIHLYCFSQWLPENHVYFL